MIWQMRKFTNDLNIVLFPNKMHYFSFSWCLDWLYKSKSKI